MSQEIQDIQESLKRLLDKSKSLFKKVWELDEEAGRSEDFRSDAGVRIKILESEMDRISKNMSEMDRRLRIFELNHDNRKERWNMVINFVIQLIWVAMAAFLLTKLGLQPPL